MAFTGQSSVRCHVTTIKDVQRATSVPVKGAGLVPAAIFPIAMLNVTEELALKRPSSVSVQIITEVNLGNTFT